MGKDILYSMGYETRIWSYEELKHVDNYQIHYCLTCPCKVLKCNSNSQNLAVKYRLALRLALKLYAMVSVNREIRTSTLVTKCRFCPTFYK